jgi:asparagine synthase (glutamine-hydrolysing)
MCGIFGFSGFVEDGLLARMGESLAHRGPDGRGSYQDEPHRFFMGMRRLSIIDLEGGWQPIYNEDRSLAVCFNGEIYNYIELHDQLVAKGHTFRTRSDTEVIVHAYEEWGRDCVKQFNGMFAFALHDSRTGETFFSRDRCGQKPLYYHQSNGCFVFASEIKAILECSRVPRACNVAAIDPYLALRYVPEPRTMFAGIFTLPAAHSLLLGKDGSLSMERYWDVPIFQGTYPPESELVDEAEGMLRNAVQLTMRSDVPVGGYLSAGVDSSMLVALMTESSDKVNTYSIGFNSPVDETHHAAETARLLGTTHHEIQCAPQDFDLLPKVVWHMDRPVGDALIIAFYKLAEGAARDLKVIISGEGADEIFAGYSFQNLIQLAEYYHQLVPGFLHQKLAMPMLRALPIELLDKFFIFPAKLGQQGKARLVEFMGSYRCRDLFENYIALKTLWPLAARAAAYTSQFKQLATEDWIPPVRDNSGRFLDRLLKLQWDEWLQDWCIIRQDKNTMAHSLEVRLPFLDHNLIELAFRVPPSLKNNGLRDKILERKIASKLLPRQVTHRKKNPFFLPMEFFFEHPQIRRLIAETLNENQLRKRGYFDPLYVKNLLRMMETREFIYLKQVMALVILELWHKVFIDNEKSW